MKNILRKITTVLDISPQHMSKVIDEITYGSQPAFRFYMLVAISTMIACIGLVANSNAVIIGAMLVAPLMVPIFGISLALVRGNTTLLLRALRAEIVGIILAIGIATFFGLLPLAIEVTPEMLARTQPNLLDLMVAVFAGLAGSYAMVNERLSPALPGVAIATAIVPPLANCGLCLAVGAYHGALGSFLLFFANFLSILLVSSLIFIASGLAYQFQQKKPWEFIRKFGLAAVSFVGMAVFLTYSLVGIVQSRYLDLTIDKILNKEFSRFYSTSFESEIHEFHENTLYILSTVRTPRTIIPPEIERIQEKLNDELKVPIKLIVRSIIAQDISAKGFTDEIIPLNLEGNFLAAEKDSNDHKIMISTQVLWEKMSLIQGLRLTDIELVQLPRGPTVIATILDTKMTRFDEKEIAELEDEIRKRLKDSQINLILRSPKVGYFDRNGELLEGWSHYGEITPEKIKAFESVNSFIKAEMNKIPNIFPVNIHIDASQSVWEILVEAVGTRVLSTGELSKLEATVSKKIQKPIRLFVWLKQEAIISKNGYSSFEDLTMKKLLKHKR